MQRQRDQPYRVPTLWWSVTCVISCKGDVNGSPRTRTVDTIFRCCMCSFKHDALESTLALSLNKMKKGHFVGLGPSGARHASSLPRARSRCAVPLLLSRSRRKHPSATPAIYSTTTRSAGAAVIHPGGPRRGNCRGSPHWTGRTEENV